MSNFTVASICQEQPDSTGANVEAVYSKVVPIYAVYRTASRVMVQFADDGTLGSEQRQSLAPVNPVRGRLNGILDEWRNGRNEKRRRRADNFDRRIADALTLALQGHGDHAQTLFTGIEHDIDAERNSWARFQYLIWAAAATIVAIWIVTGLNALLDVGLFQPDRWQMWLSAEVGTVGALFSIAIGIRNRTVVAELLSRDNIADACLRILIGAVGAAVLMAFILSDAVGFRLGGATVDAGTTNIYLIICMAFVAGFLERLVPDMLGRQGFAAVHDATAPMRSVPAVSAGTVPALANEKDPLGKRAMAAAAGSADVPEADHPDADDGGPDCCDAIGDQEAVESTDDVELPEAVGGVVEDSANRTGD